MKKKSRESKGIKNLDENFQFNNELSRKLSLKIEKEKQVSQNNIICMYFVVEDIQEKE